MRTNAIVAGVLTWVGLVASGFCQEMSPEDAAKKLLDTLHYQTGTVKIGGDIATLTLPDSLQYLDPKDARTVLVDLWGNVPETHDTLGMIVPKGVSLIASNSWAVVITYEEDGHVKDDDAEKINYDKLLAEMKKSTSEESAERVKKGYEPIKLVGWGAPPKYDREGKKLYWAQELEFNNNPNHTLNYNIRILGRKGVLVLNAIAAQQDLPVIEAATPELLSAVSFNPGNRYADFDSSTDKIAAYGIAALVAGGVAAKAGFFKLLWVGILAFKKFIIIGIAAIGGLVAKIFKKNPTA
ncbi:MAG: DUF2167 domain-containing protein [Chthoniobacterales bacterium]